MYTVGTGNQEHNSGGRDGNTVDVTGMDEVTRESFIEEVTNAKAAGRELSEADIEKLRQTVIDEAGPG